MMKIDIMYILIGLILAIVFLNFIRLFGFI
jgi:hypothetical protein